MSVLESPRAERLRRWDKRLSRAAGGIHMLRTLSWGPEVAAHWHAHGNLPEIVHRSRDYSDKEQTLRTLMGELDTQDPAGAFSEVDPNLEGDDNKMHHFASAHDVRWTKDIPITQRGLLKFDTHFVGAQAKAMLDLGTKII